MPGREGLRGWLPAGEAADRACVSRGRRQGSRLRGAAQRWAEHLGGNPARPPIGRAEGRPARAPPRESVTDAACVPLGGQRRNQRKSPKEISTLSSSAQCLRRREVLVRQRWPRP